MVAATTSIASLVMPQCNPMLPKHAKLAHMASGTMVSLEEYLSTSYESDREWVDGELLERNVGEIDHGGLQSLLVLWLMSRRKKIGIHVFTDTRVQVAPTRYRVPDILASIVKPKGRVFTIAPFLCIEIVSPEDRLSRMEIKIDDYLNFGVSYVWLIDPRKRTAWSYTHEGKRECTDLLITSEPKIELPLSDLFKELDEEVDSD